MENEFIKQIFTNTYVQKEELQMDKHIYYRLVGNGGMLFLLSMNTVLQHQAMEKHLPHMPELMGFNQLTFRLATVWNIVILNLYMSLAIVCDLLTVRNMEEKMPAIKNFRHRIFNEVVFPYCLSILVFWPIYLYDREIILPSVLDIIIAPWQNYLVHGFIFFYALWEMAYLPYDQPKRSEVKITKLVIILTAYVFNIYFTKYVSPKLWVYDVLGYLEGSFLFYLILFSPMVTGITSFYAQWSIRDLLWRLQFTKKSN